MFGMYQWFGVKVGYVDLFLVYMVDSFDQDGISYVIVVFFDLLCLYEVQVFVCQVYKFMEVVGLVECLSCLSSKGNGMREFWVLIEKGLVFGKNFFNLNNQCEVVVYLYVDRFEVLL